MRREGILAEWSRGMPVSISAAIGFVALAGVALLNGVVLVTFIESLMDRGLPAPQAIVQGALMRTSMYHVTEAPKAAIAMTEQIVTMGEELKKIFSFLKDIDHNEAKLMRHAERLNRLESEVDHIYRQEISRLFSGDETDLLNVIRWKDILGTLEEAADHVETLGNTIKEVTMKYA